MSRSKELAKNTLIITFGRISTQFISFLLLPLYTSLLSKGEYGTVDFLTTLVQLFVPVMSLMIDQGVFRFLLSCKRSEKKKAIITSALVILLVASISSAILIGSIWLFSKNGYMLWLISILVITAFNNLFLQISRGVQRTGDYALGSFICSSSTIILNVFCIAYLKMGAEGMLFATLCGNIICCAFLFLKLEIYKYIDKKAFDSSTVREILQYSLPLIPNQLSIWVMNSSDRLIVTVLLGSAANGILAVTHKFPSIFIMLFNIFLLAWHETGALHYFDDDRDTFFSDMINNIISFFSTLCIGALLLLPIVFNLLVNRAYNEAYLNIPIYLIATLFNVVIGLLGVIYVATKRTKEIAKTTILSALINIVVHVILIKYIGLYAASISTLLAYLIAMIYRIHDTNNYLRIRYDIKKTIILCILLAGSCFIYYKNNRIISLLVFPGFLLIAYFLNKEIIDGAINLIQRKTGLDKKRMILLWFSFMATLAGTISFYIFKKNNDSPKEIYELTNYEINEITPKQTIKFNEFGTENITCTGFSYDPIDKSFWIGDYGALTPNEEVHPRLIEVNVDLTNVIKDVDLSNIVDKSTNLQGVAYDDKDDSLWLAVGEKIVEIDKAGNIQKMITSDRYSKYVFNGICYNKNDDTLWVLCLSQYLLHFKKDGSVLEKYMFNYCNQDHICLMENDLLITIGADYQGGNNYICKVSSKNGQIITLYKTQQSYSLEGICFTGDQVIVINDGLYHNDLIGCSYITVYPSKLFK